MIATRRGRRVGDVGLALAACFLTLLAGYFLKARCSSPDSDQYRDLCYNDIQPLYGLRGIDQHVFPYVNGSLQNDELVDGAVEYPVLTGVFMWGSGFFAQDYREYLQASALLLAPFAFVAAYLLARMSAARALLFAGAPAVILYAFHNWDLLVVATVVGGFYAWYREKNVWAAVLFGVGGALKMYPLLFLAPLFLERLVHAEKREAWRVSGAGVGTWVAVNLPFVMINFEGWWTTYQFHSQRLPNYDTIWLIGLHPDTNVNISPAGLNITTTALMVVSFAGALWLGWRRVRKDGEYPVIQVCAALLAAFLLWNKVHSPQYALWLMPFFALLRVNIGWWVAYSLADLFVYVGVFRWFYDFRFVGAEDMTAAKGLLVFGVWMRAALLAALFFIFLRAGSAVRDRLSSQAPPSLSNVRE
ncbi:MAG: glycosyltransferase 87 family protein, partial [Actinomycetota bacterium]|nr:glycosyltransferase 87 family protein [Actinomycetota bacterium]